MVFPHCRAPSPGYAYLWVCSHMNSDTYSVPPIIGLWRPGLPAKGGGRSRHASVEAAGLPEGHSWQGGAYLPQSIRAGLGGRLCTRHLERAAPGATHRCGGGEHCQNRRLAGIAFHNQEVRNGSVLCICARHVKSGYSPLKYTRT